MEGTALRNTAPPERAGIFFGYVTAVILLAAGLIAWQFPGLGGFLRHAPSTFWTMAALAVLADARPLAAFGRRPISAIYPSICFSFAIQLGWGFAPAVLTQSSAVVVSALLMRHALWRAAF